MKRQKPPEAFTRTLTAATSLTNQLRGQTLHLIHTDPTLSREDMVVLSGLSPKELIVFARHKADAHTSAPWSLEFNKLDLAVAWRYLAGIARTAAKCERDVERWHRKLWPELNP